LPLNAPVAGEIDEERAEHVAIGAVRTPPDLFDPVPRVCPGYVGEGVTLRVDAIDEPGGAVAAAFARDHSYLPALANHPAHQHVGETDAGRLEATQAFHAHQRFGRAHPLPRKRRAFL